MASIRKLSTGKFRAEVARKGIRRSKVFSSKSAAKEWAMREEYLVTHSEEIAAQGTLSELFDRYARERSTTKRGERWEVIRLEKLAKDKIGSIRLADLKPADLADWRDRRLAEVAPGSVIREMNLIGAVLSVAVKEWGLLGSNPMTDVKRPKQPPARDRLVTKEELEKLALSAGDDLTNATARAYHAFLFALETGMRAGEIVELVWSRVDVEKRVARLDRTKNGSARNVPLSSEAVRLLRALPEADPIFGLSSRQLDALWRKLRDRAGVDGLTFHDSRHAAITRLSKKLDVLALARMVGHRNISQLQTYYNETAEDLAKRLD